MTNSVKPLTENLRLQLEAKELRELLDEFGVDLSGWDPGISANIRRMPPRVRGSGYWGEHMSFSNIEWTWLKPLLEELRDLRRRKGKESGNG